jgi:hypothetical protein
MANSNDARQDKLYPQVGDPYAVRGSDFPNKGGSGMGDKPGHDELTKESMLQEMPRHNADDGPGDSGAGTPSIWGKEGKGFAAMQNKGEGDMPATAVAIPESVDFVTGKIMCKGYSQTPVDEVGQSNVSIGR